MLRELSETLGGRWLSHEAKVFGLRAAEAGIARTHARSREEPFDEDLAFLDLDEKVRPRLGEDGSRIVRARPVRHAGTDLQPTGASVSGHAAWEGGDQRRAGGPGVGRWLDSEGRRSPTDLRPDRDSSGEALTAWDNGTMHNLLSDPLIRVRLVDGTSTMLSLPEVYEALAADGVAAFSALRPHQRHAWHAFLAQLGVIAVQRAGEAAPPRTAGEWGALLRGLTPEFSDDEPWQLLVDDPTQPAFMQCPAPNAVRPYRGRVTTPDDLDILVTAKNHDVKQAVALGCGLDDWIFALIDLQTMAGFLGAGNYGVAR